MIAGCHKLGKRNEIERLYVEGESSNIHGCMRCNGAIEQVAKAEVLAQLLPRTRENYDTFCRCRICNQVYWNGTHLPSLMEIIEKGCD